MSSDVRTPPDSMRETTRDTNTSRSEQEPPRVMGIPDILAMANHGQPSPGTRVTLPSGAVWEGGETAGTSVITLPGQDSILVAGETTAENAVTGSSVRIEALANAFHQILGVVPKLFSDWISGGSGDRDPAQTEGSGTRVVKVNSRTTISNPARANDASAGPGADVVEELTEDDNQVVSEGGAGERIPGFESGGQVRGKGGSRQDANIVRVSPGEFIVNAASASNVLPLLEALNAGWIPSPAFLAGMLPGFADGGLVGGSRGGSTNLRDLVGNGLVNPVAPSGQGLTGADFGLYGLVGDVFGGIANAALNLSGSAGSALGSALAPAFAPGGLLSSLFGSSGAAVEMPSPIAPSTAEAGGPDPMTASMKVEPEGMPAIPVDGSALGQPERSSAAVRSEGSSQMQTLAAALGQGLESAAISAGGRVGEALGAAIGPALGPAGDLAPQIGAQLGSLIGSQFGGSLRASMTLSSEVSQGGDGTTVTGSGQTDPTTADNSLTGTPADDGTTTAGDGTTTIGGQGTPAAVAPSGEGQRIYTVPSGGLSLSTILGGGGGSSAQPVVVEPGEGTDGASLPTTGIPQAQSLEEKVYNPYANDFSDLLGVAGKEVGTNLGTSLGGGKGPLSDLFGGILGNTGVDIGKMYEAVDPEKKWTPAIGRIVSEFTGIPWNPTDENGNPVSTSVPEMTRQQQVELGAIQGAVSGLQSKGLVGGITGAITGAASTAGSMAGTIAGTAIAPFLGPLGALAPSIGSMLGSMVAQTGAELITKPIELVASAVKEEVGSGFGLVDLAKGPGGRTAKGDVFNFNGMDPMSAFMSVERLHRRITLAQQRGGMGR